MPCKEVMRYAINNVRTSCNYRKAPARHCYGFPRSRKSAITLCQSPTLRRYSSQPADSPDFVSILDKSPKVVKTGRRHGYGLIILAIIPITAFALGTWQVKRLEWKTQLISKFEDRLIKDPLPLPPKVDTGAIHDFDYRRVVATGVFRHDQEMLLGPRMHEGKEGYFVITPLERGNASNTVLVNRGWIPKTMKRQAERKKGLPQGTVTVQGLLREPPKKNYFTPDNNPESGAFYFLDVEQMAQLAHSQSVLVEETMTPDLLVSYDRESKGIPISRAPEVNLRNNHAQYIFTWYSLAAATTVMLWMVTRKPPTQVSNRVRRSKEWA